MLVDARSGDLRRLRNLIRNASAPALVFDPNPIVEQGSRTGLDDNDNKDSGVPASLYRKVTLENLNGGCLEGPLGQCRSSCAFSVLTGRNFAGHDEGGSCDCFDAAMAYFHIDRMQRYLQSLGFSNVVHRAIPVNLHATDDDNSFYSPGPPTAQLRRRLRRTTLRTRT